MSDINLDDLSSLLPDPDNDDQGNPVQVRLPRANLRKLEHAARESQRKAREMEERLHTLEREQAFVLAGINVQDPAAKYFVKGYEGELTADAIKAAAVEARVVQSGTPATPGEIAGHQAAMDAMAGAVPTSNALDVEAKLAELGKKKFAVADDEGRAAHIQEIARVAREGGLRIPLT